MAKTDSLGFAMLKSGRMKFALGEICATQGALKKVPAEYLVACLKLHSTGDWGMLDPDDRAMNDRAVRTGNRILSAYPLPDEADMLWIITEADRSATTFLLPAEY